MKDPLEILHLKFFLSLIKELAANLTNKMINLSEKKMFVNIFFFEI